MITLKTNVVTTQDYYSQSLIVECMKLKLNMSIKILAFNNYSIKSKYYDNSNKLRVGKMIDKTAGVAT